MVALAPGTVDHLVVVLAQPGDDTAILGGPLAALLPRSRVDIVLATGGAAGSLDDLHRLVPDARLHRLALPDGSVAERFSSLTAALVGLTNGSGTTIVATRHSGDDQDNDPTAGAAAAAAWRTDARLAEPAGEAWLLMDPHEDSPFEDLHAGEPDPWHVRDSWYERRKRALTLAALPEERYAAALEIGCSIGALAQDLATRAGRVVAVDESPTALASVERTELPCGSVETHLARLPEGWDGLRGKVVGVDLVVVSEVGYFLSPSRLATLATRVRALLDGVERACVLACHWRHEIVGWPLRGDDVHDILEDVLGRRRRSHLLEEDFVLTVWS